MRKIKYIWSGFHLLHNISFEDVFDIIGLECAGIKSRLSLMSSVDI